MHDAPEKLLLYDDVIDVSAGMPLLENPRFLGDQFCESLLTLVYYVINLNTMLDYELTVNVSAGSCFYEYS